MAADSRIKAIEAQAMDLGWKPGELWEIEGHPGQWGLAKILRPGDAIEEVSREFIVVARTHHDGSVTRNRFWNHRVSQPWAVVLDGGQSHA